MAIRTAPESRLDGDLPFGEAHETQKWDISNPKIDYPLLLGLPWTSVLPVGWGKKTVSKLDFLLVLLASLLALPWPPWNSIKLA